MSPEAQRVAIAEACGWGHRPATRNNPVDHGGMRLPNHFSDDPIEAWWKDGDPEHTGVYSQPPRFLTDLNAMHEAEKVLTDEQLGDYETHLERICFVPRNGISWEDHLAGVGWNHSEAIYATAAQRAEAFLRTVGKWEDGK